MPITSPEMKKAIELWKNANWDELLSFIGLHHQLAKETDRRGDSLLHYLALKSGTEKIITELIDLGADPNHPNGYEATPIAYAIGAGNPFGLDTLDVLGVLLDLGADPDRPVEGPYPALHWSIVQHKPGHLDFLLARGVNRNTVTNDSPPEALLDVAKRVDSKYMLPASSEQFLHESGISSPVSHAGGNMILMKRNCSWYRRFAVYFTTRQRISCQPSPFLPRAQPRPQRFPQACSTQFFYAFRLYTH